MLLVQRALMTSTTADCASAHACVKALPVVLFVCAGKNMCMCVPEAPAPVCVKLHPLPQSWHFLYSVLYVRL